MNERLTISPGEDIVTLVTCTPYGVNTHRLLVRGHRVPMDNHKEINPLIKYIKYGSLLGLIAVMWVVLYVCKRKKNGIIQIVVMAVLLTAVLLQSNAIAVAAKENNVVPELDSGRSGGLTVCYQSNEDGNVIPLKNAEFRICRVSDLTVKITRPSIHFYLNSHLRE